MSLGRHEPKSGVQTTATVETWSQKSKLSSLKKVCRKLPSVPVNLNGISLKYPLYDEILLKYGNIRALKNNSGLQG